VVELSFSETRRAAFGMSLALCSDGGRAFQILRVHVQYGCNVVISTENAKRKRKSTPNKTTTNKSCC